MNMGTLIDSIRNKKRNYNQCFKTPAGQQVLIDLTNFCGVGLAAGVKRQDGTIDRDATLIAIGRQEVILRIQKNLHLSSDQLFAIATGHTIQDAMQGDQDGK